VTQDRDEDRKSAPKERVLHTRVPAVLEEELKRLSKNLRVPVSNVVRAILEDALDAVDTVSGRAEGELLGFVERLEKKRDELRHRVRREDEDEEATTAERSPCPSDGSGTLEGVIGYQALVLATEVKCSVCGRALAPGSTAHRALFDDPGKRVFLGAECRLLPE
jgi:hypothetical protein